jgi:hypothetical protein
MAVKCPKKVVFHFNTGILLFIYTVLLSLRKQGDLRSEASGLSSLLKALYDRGSAGHLGPKAAGDEKSST